MKLKSYSELFIGVANFRQYVSPDCAGFGSQRWQRDFTERLEGRFLGTDPWKDKGVWKWKGKEEEISEQIQARNNIKWGRVRDNMNAFTRIKRAHIQGFHFFVTGLLTWLCQVPSSSLKYYKLSSGKKIISILALIPPLLKKESLKNRLQVGCHLSGDCPCDPCTFLQKVAASAGWCY